MRNLGKKIVVVGVTAAGKTTFARKLAAKTNLPLICIDALMWQPGWKYIGEEEIATQLRLASEADEWIIEGYLVEEARSVVFNRADTVIYLDYVPWVASWRYIKRWWKHRKNPRPELPGSPEKFSFKFLDLAWSRGETAYVHEYMNAVQDQTKIVRITSLKESKAFLDSVV